MVEFHNKHPDLRDRGVETFSTFIEGQGAAIDAERARLWGAKSAPQHWTNVNFYERPKSLGPEFQKLVNDGYDYRNWQLHSGAAGVNGLNDEALKALCANALHVVHTVAISAVDLVATELRIRGTIEDCPVAAATPVSPSTWTNSINASTAISNSFENERRVGPGCLTSPTSRGRAAGMKDSDMY